MKFMTWAALALRLTVATCCVGGLWWFLLPEWPEIAVLDGIIAGSVATLVVGRLGFLSIL